MPLESASPPPQSWPSDILCFPGIGRCPSSSREREVTTSSRLRDRSDSESVAEQAHVSGWNWASVTARAPPLRIRRETQAALVLRHRPEPPPGIPEPAPCTPEGLIPTPVTRVLYTRRDFHRPNSAAPFQISTFIFPLKAS